MKRRAITARRRPKNKQPEVILVRSGSVTTRIYTTEKSGNCCYSVTWDCGGQDELNIRRIGGE